MKATGQVWGLGKPFHTFYDLRQDVNTHLFNGLVVGFYSFDPGGYFEWYLGVTQLGDSFEDLVRLDRHQARDDGYIFEQTGGV